MKRTIISWIDRRCTCGVDEGMRMLVIGTVMALGALFAGCSSSQNGVQVNDGWFSGWGSKTRTVGDTSNVQVDEAWGGGSGPKKGLR